MVATGTVIDDITQRITLAALLKVTMAVDSLVVPESAKTGIKLRVAACVFTNLLTSVLKDIQNDLEEEDIQVKLTVQLMDLLGEWGLTRK